MVITQLNYTTKYQFPQPSVIMLLMYKSHTAVKGLVVIAPMLQLYLSVYCKRVEQWPGADNQSDFVDLRITNCNQG